MIVTALLPGKNGKKKVYVDECYLFSLYPKELKQYEIKIDQPISKESVDSIYEGCLLHRGRLRAMNLLIKKDYTRAQIKEKLLQSEYTEPTITSVIEYLDQFHYLDDVRFATQFISFQKSSKSRRQIEQLLKGKGVSKEDITSAYEACGEEYDLEEEEQQLLHNLIAKKCKRLHKDTMTYEDWGKVYQFLAAKGFSSGSIRNAVTGYRESHDDF